MHNISKLIYKLKLLQADFIGFSISFPGLLRFFETIALAIFILCLCYLVGSKLIVFFIKKKDRSWQNHFFSLGVGHIVVGTGILVLGMFSLVYLWVFLLYFLVLTLFACYKTNFSVIFQSIKKLIQVAFSKFTFEKVIFIVLALSVFLRLLPPEIGPDAIDYHTGYPRAYVQNHTMMLPPRGEWGSATIPQLSEMYYTAVVQFGFIEATKYIHFFFFVLIAFVLWRITFPYASLLFLSTPLVIHIAPSAYGDLQGVYLFLLSVLALGFKEKLDKKLILLSALFFGGFLATKMFGLEFFPIMLLYLLTVLYQNWKKTIEFGSLFVFASVSIPLLWYVRSYLLARNFLYFADTGKPQTNIVTFVKQQFFLSHFATIAIHDLVINFLPLFFIGILVFLLRPKLWNTNFKEQSIIFVGITSFVYLLIFFMYTNQRYLLPSFVPAMVCSSIGLSFIAKNTFIRIVIRVFFIGMSLYYLCNSFLVLPYGLGWANTDKYLTRNFLLDKEAYYDFNHQFALHIGKNETIVTYSGSEEYYYATFSHHSVYFYLNNKDNLFQRLQSKHIDKLLLHGGDINWFCKNLSIQKQCAREKFVLLSEYKPVRQYLYKIF